MIPINSRLYGLLFAVLALVAEIAFASDREKESRWADQTVEFLVVGEAVWLQGHDGKFLGLYTEAAATPAKGAAIIMHGLGAHPDWQDVVAPLRVGLPEKGWTTLSIQMPILANDAEVGQYAPLFAEVPARIDAARRYLQGRGYHNIVLVAHSLGTAMTTSYLAGNPASIEDVKAFVAVGMRGRLGSDPRMHTTAFLERIQLPMLDLYGSQDEDAVKSASVRLAAGKTKGTYEQTEIPEADHFFRGKSDRLVEIVSAWLDHFARH